MIKVKFVFVKKKNWIVYGEYCPLVVKFVVVQSRPHNPKRYRFYFYFIIQNTKFKFKTFDLDRTISDV